MITLTVGQHQTLTAQFQDSLGHPVTDVDPALLAWTTDDNTIVSLGPNITSSTVPLTNPPSITGLVAVIQAVASGIVNVTATYVNSNNETFTNVTSVQVVDPDVAAIVVT